MKKPSLHSRDGFFTEEREDVMLAVKNTQPINHFAKHLFLISHAYVGRKKAKDDVDNYLQKMKKSIIWMSLNYSDIDRLKEKLDNLINWERRYSKFLKPEDNETLELKNKMNYLEEELRIEREEKQKKIYENDEKIKELTDSLNNIKAQLKYLLMERAKRSQRLIALEKKIRENVDLDRFYRGENQQHP